MNVGDLEIAATGHLIQSGGGHLDKCGHGINVTNTLQTEKQSKLKTSEFEKSTSKRQNISLIN